MSLIDYFVRGLEIQPLSKGISNEVGIDRKIELQHLFNKLQLGEGIPNALVTMMIAFPSLDRASLLYLCFLDEINDDGVVIELVEVIDEVVSHEKYHDEMEMMGISQIIDVVQLKIVSSFNLFGVFAIDVSKVIQIVPTPKL